MKLQNIIYMNANSVRMILLVAALLIVGCKDNNELTAAEKDVALLTGTTWGSASVINHTDGDLSYLYEDLIIQFVKKPTDGFDGTFEVSNGGYAFPENSGKWKLNADTKKITLDSGRELDFQIQPSTLVLDFIIIPQGGRVKGLSGHFTVSLHSL
jgi:hypothetical protein